MSKKYKIIPENILLNQCAPFEDESKILILKIIEQAIKDYLTLENRVGPIDQFNFESAREFLFNDEYKIRYGIYNFNLEELTHFLGLNIEWIRDKARYYKSNNVKRVRSKKNNEKRNKKNTKISNLFSGSDGMGDE